MKKLILLSLCYFTLFAHPHTFIEIYPTIKVENNQIKNIHFKWKLDEMTSSMLIMEFDTNGDGKLDKKENLFIYLNYFTELSDNNFYTDITINDKIQKFPKPKNFKATIENFKICYSFDIELNNSIKNLKIDFGDTDFFIAPILKKEFLNIDGAISKITELDNDFYFGYRLELLEGK